MLTSPLLFAAGTFGAALGWLKNKKQHKQKEAPRRGACTDKGSCLCHVRSAQVARTWLACAAAVYYVWWWIAEAWAAALTCDESLEMAERSLTLSPDEGIPGTGRWVTKAGVGWTRGGLWPKAEPMMPGWRPISCWCMCKATGVGG